MPKNIFDTLTMTLMNAIFGMFTNIIYLYMIFYTSQTLLTIHCQKRVKKEGTSGREVEGSRTVSRSKAGGSPAPMVQWYRSGHIDCKMPIGAGSCTAMAIGVILSYPGVGTAPQATHCTQHQGQRPNNERTNKHKPTRYAGIAFLVKKIFPNY